MTGSAGFIGANLVLRLLDSKEPLSIVGLDNLNSYYDPSLKEYRLRLIEQKYSAVAGGLRLGGRNEGLIPDPSSLIPDPSSLIPDPIRDPHEYQFIKGDIADKALVDRLFAEYQFDIVVNLAAQAGVRYSIENPDVYIESNIIGFYNILEACRRSFVAGAPQDDKRSQEGASVISSEGEAEVEKSQYRGVQHLVYASSSSVYGGNKKIPFSVDDRVDNPVSLYAATKKSNELFAHCYSKLYGIPTTGLRFFTVYGPAGRPDMAYFGFTNKLLKGETIRIFNYGNCRRDFTYVDDIVEGIYRVMFKAPSCHSERSEDPSLREMAPSGGKSASSGKPQDDSVPYAIYNIGGGQPENLLDFVQTLQEELVRAGVLPQDYDFEAHKQLVPMQPGDVPTTYADASALERDFGFTPKIPLREGLRHFAEWYKEYYQK